MPLGNIESLCIYLVYAGIYIFGSAISNRKSGNRESCGFWVAQVSKILKPSVIVAWRFWDS